MTTTTSKAKMKPEYAQRDYAPVLEYDAYTRILANNGDAEVDFIRARGKNWIVLEPEDLLAGLSERFSAITQIYELSKPPGQISRFVKFRTIMAILNTVTKNWDTAMSKKEFTEIVMKSVPKIPGGMNRGTNTN